VGLNVMGNVWRWRRRRLTPSPYISHTCGGKCNWKCMEMASVCDDAIHEVRRAYGQPQQPRASIGQRTTRADAAEKEEGWVRAMGEERRVRGTECIYVVECCK